MTRVKICGLTSKVDALMAVGYGADSVGIVNVESSKRFVGLETARHIFQEMPIFISKVIVAAPSSMDEALKLSDCGADYIQLHGNESLDFVRELKDKTKTGLIKQIPVDDKCLRNSRKYSEYVDAILLDTSVDGELGGTGVVHDWSISKNIVNSIDKPVILAGGLTPRNVSEAIDAVNPYAVDVSSGVESSPGLKDEALVKSFIETVRRK